MGELFAVAFSWINLPYTIIMGVLFVYWLMVIIGALDVEVFDFDVEFEGVLGILNVGNVPFSIWLSVFGLQTWLYSIMLNILADSFGLLNGLLFVRFLLIFAIIVPFSSITTKFITKPLDKLFANTAKSKKDFISHECEITSSTVDETFGTAEITMDGSPQIIDVRCKKEEGLKKGEKVLICDFDEKDDTFLVERIY